MDDDQDDRGEMKCIMVLCLEGGPAHDIKWCPLPAHDRVRPIYIFKNVQRIDQVLFVDFGYRQ